MASFAQLLAVHRRVLLLDAASTRTTVGLLEAGQADRWSATEGDASRLVFRGVRELLEQGGASLTDIDAFVFCEGPGSMLGVRTVAMALRTWLALKPAPVFAYQSLALLARGEWTARPRALCVIADARRETWHAQDISVDGTLVPLQRLPEAGLAGKELVTPTHFRTWAPLPPLVTEIPYDLPTLLPRVHDADLLRSVEQPDAFQHEPADYRKWSAQTHSSETARRA